MDDDGVVRLTVVIDALPEHVFPYLIDAERMVRWMGNYAVLDPTPGGTFLVDINGVPVRGTFVVVQPPELVVITWGMAGSDDVPPGSSRVEFRLDRVGDTTALTVEHHGLPLSAAAQHLVGWTHFIDRLTVAAVGRDPGPDPWADRPSV